MAELLRLESACFAYRPNHNILDRLYLEAGEGEIVAVVGRNGSGKSTLFRCLTLGLPDSGSLFIRGQWLDPHQRPRHIAFLAQNGFLPDDLRVGPLLRRRILPSILGPALQGDHLLEGIADKRIGMLSGGERRYLEFLFVLSLDRPVTILDEPFSEMAPLYSARMIRLLREQAAGRTFLISDHDWHSVNSVATRLELMVNGRLHTVKGEEDLRRLGYLAARD